MSEFWWTVAIVGGCAIVWGVAEATFALVRRLQRKAWERVPSGMEFAHATHTCLTCRARAPLADPIPHDEWCPRWTGAE